MTALGSLVALFMAYLPVVAIVLGWNHGRIGGAEDAWRYVPSGELEMG